MENYPGNSKRPAPQAQHQEPRKIERIVQSPVIRQKVPLGRRISNNMFGGDWRNFFSYLWHDTIAPAGKDLISDTIRGSADRALWGDNAPSHIRARAGHTNYRGAFGMSSISAGRNPRNDDRRELSSRARATHAFEEIVFPNRVEAESVLRQLYDFQQQYDAVTVSELYEMCGISSQHTDRNWGWVDLTEARIMPVRGGYLLNLPRPVRLD